MVIQTITVSNCQPQTIVIGRRGTYDTLQIAFDLSYLVENYGSGTAVLAVKRSQDTSAYPAVTSQADNILTWMISDVDTYYVGSGECQLMWYVEGGLAKTIIYPIVVMRDILTTSEEAPDAYQTWVDDLTALGAETLQNAQDAAQSASDAEQAKDDAVEAKEAAEAALEEFTTPTASATSLAPSAEATASYSNGHFSFGIPRGEQGAKGDPGEKGDPGSKGDPGNNGFSPTITVADITGGHRVTITDVNGTRTVDVMNGTNGTDGTDGEDGYSPVVTITDITDGHRVTITDKTHPSGQSFDVMDGQDGASDAGEVTYDETATYPSGSVGAELSNQKNAIDQKQNAPSSAGTAGQVLGLDSNLNPAWVDQTGGGGGMNIVNLSGTQITQVGADNTFYVCGELTELTFTAPAVGITMIRFTSGTTPTVCTINGVTSWMYGFDPTTDIEASKTYDINVLNGIGVAGWA